MRKKEEEEEEEAFGTPLAVPLLLEKEHEALEDDRAEAEVENVEVVAIFLFNLCIYPRQDFLMKKTFGKNSSDTQKEEEQQQQ